MKCGPEECPIVAFSDLTAAEQRVERKRIAAKMMEQGFTEQQIAKQLGVSQATISGDLQGLSITDKPKRPKGGRPKGSKKPPRSRGGAEKFTKARELVRPRVVGDEALNAKELEKEHGISKDTFERAALAEQARKEALVELEVDPKTLSMTAQGKLDAAIKQYKKRLDEEFSHRVNLRVRAFLEETILPTHRKEQEEAKRIMRARKGIMDKTSFRLIWSALHPDSRNSISDRKLAEAFDVFSRLEKLLLDERQSETKFQQLPGTMAEWDKMRAAADAARRAKRGTNAVRPR